MARFKAYDSDTSSGDEEQEKQIDVEIPEKGSNRVSSDVESHRSLSEGSTSSSSSSSDMDEQELISSSSRRHKKSKSRDQDQNTLVEDENEDIRYAHEINMHVPSASSSSLSPPRIRPMGDPNIIPWAQHVGVDAQKMHVMQTSLFRMEEEAAALKAASEATKPKKTNIRLIAGSEGANRKHGRESDGDGLRFDSRERASFAQNIEPPVFRPTRKYARVAIASSIANENEGAYVDAGLAMGRSFRVGWGPSGKLVHLGSICGPTSTTYTPANTSIVTLTKAMPRLASSRSDPNATTSSSSTPSALSAKLLQHHLSYTTISPDEFGIPSALPTSPSYPSPAVSRNINSAPPTSSEPLNFTSFLSLFPSIDASSPAPVFRLGSALFDPVDLRLGRSKRNGLDSGTSITPDIRNRVSTLRRKAALSKWLEDVVKPNVDGDLRMQTNGSNVAYTAADAAFTHLTGHQISQASASAADGGYIKLSTLISQAGGDDLFKDYILSQLEIWKSEKLSPGSNAALTSSPNGLVGRSVWRVYKLLSGLIQYEGPDTRAGDDIFTGLDWKRVFGLCLWYGTSVDASVSDVVKVYESILEESQESDVSRPVPKWIASKPKKGLSSSLGSSPLGLFAAAKQTQPEDPLYILIKLHADPALSLSKALNPLSFAPTGLDWGIGMCWHLYIILSRVMRIRDFADRGNRGIRPTTRRPRGSLVNGFGGSDRDDSSTDGLSNQGDDSFPPEGHSPSADLLTTGYAFVLESWGMLQEAAFVLMHLEGSAGREKALKELLARSAPSLDDWMMRGLVGSLKLPMHWVDEAKATYELDQGNIYTAYELYISAQLFNAAHNLALLDLAPDAVIRKDLDLLRNLFAPFDMVGRRDKVENWFVKGKVFLDYTEIMTKLPKLLNEVAAENEERPSIPDATQEAAMDELSKRALKTISLLPDILHRSRQVDPRHPAALEEMSKDLLKLVERVKPLLLTRIQPPTLSVFDGATKINLVRGIGYARFLQSIEA